jgi:6-phosphogluconolactonase (cycloisomerase 2 family)
MAHCWGPITRSWWCLTMRKSSALVVIPKLTTNHSPGAVSVEDVRVLKSPLVGPIQRFPRPSVATVPDRQNGSFAHETIVDPFGKYVLIPDLGADLVRILAVSPLNDTAVNPAIKEFAPLAVDRGTGPRHGVFWSPGGKNMSFTDPLFFIVVGELSANVTVFRAGYMAQDAGLTFTQMKNIPAVGLEKQPKVNYPAEITVSVSVHDMAGVGALD